MNYELKYTKYKVKYLNLKEKIDSNQLEGINSKSVVANLNNQLGGAVLSNNKAVLSNNKAVLSNNKAVLSNNNNKAVLSNDKPDLYLFKASWCGHCNHFLPEWEKLSNNNKLKEKVNFITIDADINPQEITKFNIEGFPTIIYKNKNKQIEYNGKRTTSEITKFINSNL